jgi:predicted TIM-barrel fold metal-dependent hydrolase
VFIGHGPAWWGEISADYRRADRIGYPKGKIKPGGSTDRLLADYPNIYGDLSAGSGYNALTRDPDFTPGFIARHWRKLMLGTDYLRPWQELPQVEFLHTFPMTEEQRQAILGGNAEQLLLKR